jgi:hypothetical protein
VVVERSLRHRLAAGRREEGRHQPVGGDILQQIAHRAGAQRREHGFVVERGQRDHPDARPVDAQPAGRGDAVEHGHPQVHQDDIRGERGRQTQ